MAKPQRPGSKAKTKATTKAKTEDKAPVEETEVTPVVEETNEPEIDKDALIKELQAQVATEAEQKKRIDFNISVTHTLPVIKWYIIIWCIPYAKVVNISSRLR